MDKYEYNLKLDQMKGLCAEEHYAAAAEIADTINWNKVKNVNALVKAGEIYEKLERYSESRDILLMAYDRSPIGRTIIFRLAEVAIKMKDFDSATEYYTEFVEIAPHDNLRYVLQYNMKKAQGADYSELIPILEELKEVEYTEEWAYELAYLYHKAGKTDKCVDACDELILWFGEGPYVERALELKMIYQPLTKAQEEKYRRFRLEKQGITSISAEEMEKAGEYIHDAVEIPEIDINTKFNTVNLQKEIAKGMQQIINATEKTTVSDTIDNIKKIVEEIPYLQIPSESEKSEDEDTHIETDEEIDGSLKINFKEMLGEDADGQISMLTKERAMLERQITGQMTIQDVLSEWEKTRVAAEKALEKAEQQKLESAKARALQEAGDIMERLNDVIPKLDAGISPKQILKEKYMSTPAVQIGAGNFAKAPGNEPAIRLGNEPGMEPETELRNGPEMEPGTELEMGLSNEPGIGLETGLGNEPGMEPETGLINGSEYESEMELGNEPGVEPETGLINGSEYEPEMELGNKPGVEPETGLINGSEYEPEMALGNESGIEPEMGLGNGPEAEPEIEPVLIGELNGKPENNLNESLHAGRQIPEQAERSVTRIAFGPAAGNLQMGAELSAVEAGVSGAALQSGAGAVEAAAQSGVGAVGAMAQSGVGVLGAALQPGAGAVEAMAQSGVGAVEAMAQSGVGAVEAVGTAAKAAVNFPAIGIIEPKEEAGQRQQAASVGMSRPQSSRDVTSSSETADIRTEIKTMFRPGMEPPIVESGSEAVPDLSEGLAAPDAEKQKELNKAVEEAIAREASKPKRTPGAVRRQKTKPMPSLKSLKKAGSKFNMNPFEESTVPKEMLDYYDDSNKEELKHLTEEQKAVFSYFVPVSGMEHQLSQALEAIAAHLKKGEPAYTGNLIIQGGQGCGKTVLATSMIRALQKETNKPNNKIGKIDAATLNKKDIQMLLRKVEGGCLIIEKAGGLSKQAAVTLSLLLEQENSGLLVILEDTSKGIKRVLAQDDGFARKFTETISVPIFTNDDLVAFAKAYSSELGYMIDDMAILALYNRISNIQRLDQATTLTEVKEIVDEAIDREARGGLHKFFSILTAKRYSDDDRIILQEKDFQ